MDLEKLSFNKLTKEEQVKWKELKDLVIQYVDRNMYEEYTRIVDEALMNVLIDDHIAGYSMGNGYYYVIEGDFGELSLEILTEDVQEIAFYILKNIYYLYASDIELKNRTIYQKYWKYYHEKNTEIGEYSWVKNADYVYSAYYDPRKYVFETVIRELKVHFSGEWVDTLIDSYKTYLNMWFDDEHWVYDDKTEIFIEASSSVDKRFKK